MNRENVNQLGTQLDGWADLIEGQGEKADAVRVHLQNSLNQRQMPKVSIEAVQGYVRMTEPTSSDRPYLITKKKPGYATAIFVANYGRDLYVSWKTYHKSPIRWYMVLTAVFLLGFFLDFAFTSELNKARWQAITDWFFSALIRYMIIVVIVAAILDTLFSDEKVRGNREWIVYYSILLVVPLIGWFIISRLLQLPQRPPFPPLFSFSLVTRCLLGMIALPALVWFIAFISQRLYGRSFAWFPTMPTVFDADDCTAMSLSVHKSLLHALDEVGVDTSQLRLQNEITQGRIGEPV